VGEETIEEDGITCASITTFDFDAHECKVLAMQARDRVFPELESATPMDDSGRIDDLRIGDAYVIGDLLTLRRLQKFDF
jgi:hypothetical protein